MISRILFYGHMHDYLSRYTATKLLITSCHKPGTEAHMRGAKSKPVLLSLEPRCIRKKNKLVNITSPHMISNNNNNVNEKKRRFRDLLSSIWDIPPSFLTKHISALSTKLFHCTNVVIKYCVHIFPKWRRVKVVKRLIFLSFLKPSPFYFSSSSSSLLQKGNNTVLSGILGWFCTHTKYCPSHVKCDRAHMYGKGHEGYPFSKNYCIHPAFSFFFLL